MQETNDQPGGRGRLSRIDLNLLRVFDLVYRERHLGRAAAALHLSQPAVSHALARLRRQLDDALFRRQGGRLVPTPRAEQLAPRLSETLASLEAILRPERGFDPARELRRVRLAMADEMEPMLLPPLLARLAEVAPEAVLSSVRIERTELKTDLAAGRLDLAIDIAQPVQGLRHAPLFEDRYCVSPPARGGSRRPTTGARCMSPCPPAAAARRWRSSSWAGSALSGVCACVARATRRRRGRWPSRNCC